MWPQSTFSMKQTQSSSARRQPTREEVDREYIKEVVQRSLFIRESVDVVSAAPRLRNVDAIDYSEVFEVDEIEYLDAADKVLSYGLRGCIPLYNHENVSQKDDARETVKPNMEGLTLILDEKVNEKDAAFDLGFCPRELYGFILATPAKGILDAVPESKVLLKAIDQAISRTAENGPQDLIKALITEILKKKGTGQDPIPWTCTIGRGASSFTGIFKEKQVDGTYILWIVTHIRHKDVNRIVRAILEDLERGFMQDDPENRIPVSDFVQSPMLRQAEDVCLRNARRVHYETAAAAGLSIPYEVDTVAILEDERHDRPRLAKPFFMTPYSYFTQADIQTYGKVVLSLNKATYLNHCQRGLVFLTKPLAPIKIFPFKGGSEKWNGERRSDIGVGSAPICAGRKTHRQKSSEVSSVLEGKAYSRHVQKITKTYVSGKGETLSLQPRSSEPGKCKRILDASWKDYESDYDLLSWLSGQGLQSEANKSISLVPLAVKVSKF